MPVPFLLQETCARKIYSELSLGVRKTCPSLSMSRFLFDQLLETRLINSESHFCLTVAAGEFNLATEWVRTHLRRSDEIETLRTSRTAHHLLRVNRRLRAARLARVELERIAHPA